MFQQTEINIYIYIKFKTNKTAVYVCKFSPHYQDPLGKTSGQNHLGTVYSLDIWVVVSEQ